MIFCCLSLKCNGRLGRSPPNWYSLWRMNTQVSREYAYPKTPFLTADNVPPTARRFPAENRTSPLLPCLALFRRPTRLTQTSTPHSASLLSFLTTGRCHFFFLRGPQGSPATDWIFGPSFISEARSYDFLVFLGPIERRRPPSLKPPVGLPFLANNFSRVFRVPIPWFSVLRLFETLTSQLPLGGLCE